MKGTICLLSGLLLADLPMLSMAGPLQRADLPAAPAWVAHVDWDAVRNSAVGLFIQDELNKPNAQAKLAAFQAVFNIDLPTQLHGITLYSAGSTPQEAVLLCYADFDPQRLVTLAKAAKDAQNAPYKSHTIYSWIDENKKKKHPTEAARIYAAIDGRRIIFGQREERVARALDVLDGAAPSLASSQEFAGFGTAGDPSFLEAGARKLELPDSNPNAAILRLSKQVTLQFAQVQQQVSGTLTLEANNDEIAGYVSSIAQGLVALMKLQQAKPEAVRFAEALSLKQDGPRVVVSLSLPGKDVVGLLKADAARKAAKKAQREGK